MTGEFTRFTTNFSALIQEQRFGWSRQQMSVASVLSQTSVRLAASRATLLHSDSRFFPAHFSAPFLQFADAVNRQSFAIQLPSGQPLIAAKNQTLSWMGWWSNLTMIFANRLLDGFREVQTTLTAVLNVLSKPVIQERIQPIVMGEWLSSPLLAQVILSLRTDPTQRMQSILSTLPVSKIRLSHRESTAEILTRYQSTTKMIRLPLVDVTANFSPTISRQPSTFLPQVEAKPPGTSLLREIRSYILMQNLTELAQSSRTAPYSVSQRILKLPIHEATSFPIALQALSISRSAEPVSNINQTGDVFIQSAQYSTSPKLPAPAISAKSTESADSATTITFNGGIHVQITAQTVDQANAQETARVIAEQVMREVNRISERNRFRRGL